MQCPCCYSTQTFKNGFRKGRQCYKCKQCGRQFLESYQAWCYSNDVKQLCLKMHLKGMSLREIERVTDIHHTTILHWLRKARLDLDEISNT
ncbi:IS1 family transposase (plasmid) [Nostoc sp. C052]|uniref:IS1 family transposase n=1 Tax=Nostoc sp. TaxID=1180 RepID=UPI0015C3C1B7|nr:IS1 family transposase [Nostoc sp. C052]